MLPEDEAGSATEEEEAAVGDVEVVGSVLAGEGPEGVTRTLPGQGASVGKGVRITCDFV